jgi:hypothetical protein
MACLTTEWSKLQIETGSAGLRRSLALVPEDPDIP